MKLTINGEEHDLEAADLPDLIEQLGLLAATLLIEHNGDALHRSEWKSRSLLEGDRLEFLRIAAGG